nr:MAG TPA: hypothetical protein [Caudoviricetes sp.]
MVSLCSFVEYPRFVTLFIKIKRDRSFLPISAISLLDYICRPDHTLLCILL